jgi:sporulation protein YlmC with PRC-barrel domain
MRRMFHSAAGLAAALTASAALAQDAARPPITVKGDQVQGQSRTQVEVQQQAPVQRESRKLPENSAPPAASQQQDDGRSVRATELIGTDLVLENGDSMGRVNDLIIDNRNGQVAYVIVETDQDYRPIPWKALAMHSGEQADDRYLMIGMEKDRFLQGPAIQRTEWQTYTTPQWYTQWQTFQPRVTQFYSNVNTRIPNDFRRPVNATNREVNAANRTIDRAERKANRKLD